MTTNRGYTFYMDIVEMFLDQYTAGSRPHYARELLGRQRRRGTAEGRMHCTEQSPKGLL